MSLCVCIYMMWGELWPQQGCSEPGEAYRVSSHLTTWDEKWKSRVLLAWQAPYTMDISLDPGYIGLVLISASLSFQPLPWWIQALFVPTHHWLCLSSSLQPLSLVMEISKVLVSSLWAEIQVLTFQSAWPWLFSPPIAAGLSNFRLLFLWWTLLDVFFPNLLSTASSGKMNSIEIL